MAAKHDRRSPTAKKGSLGNVRLVHAVIREDYAGRQKFSHNFERALFPDGARIIALLSTDGSSYSEVALMKKGTGTSTFQSRVTFSEVQSIRRITFEEIESILPPRLRRHFEARISASMSEIPRGTAEGVVQVLIGQDASFLGRLNTLKAKIDRKPIDLRRVDKAWRMMAYEKDAVDTALGLGGHPRAAMSDEQLEELQRPSHILDFFGGASILEDRQIEHDASAFGNLKASYSDATGRVFYDSDAGTRVTVVNVNRAPLETILGVDLIVYYHRFNSYILIQYKRMVAEDKVDGPKEWRFRPSSDKNFEKELNSMLKHREAVVPHGPQGSADYRLSNDPFFFKFCRGDQFAPDKTRMIPGLYVQSKDLAHFLGSTESRGPRGGAYLGFDNFGRLLPNTMFLALARTGWIGSRGMGSSKIETIIRNSVSRSRSVVAATVMQQERGPTAQEMIEEAYWESRADDDDFPF